MPKDMPSFLKIYCICGQKMKVSQDMYGLPGKCIACRQKIRVPHPDELPANTTVIYLKDFPQFLRQRKTESSEGDLASGIEREAEANLLEGDETTSKIALDTDELEREVLATPSDELLGEPQAPGVETPREPAPKERPREKNGKRRRPSSSTEYPLDTLEPLRVLCSLEYKLKRQLETFRDSGRAENKQLEHYLSEVKKRRRALNETIRQRLMESAIELTNTQDKIVQAELALRVGEMDYAFYSKTVDRLRRRRERLERRQHNLRSWLATRDPHRAGGYIDRSVDNIPHEEITLAFSADEESAEPLVSMYTNQLRKAMLDRDKARNKLRELNKLVEREAESSEQLALRQADLQAEWSTARSTVAFCRARLEDVKADLTSDIKGIDAQLDSLLSKMQLGEIDRIAFDAQEKYLLTAKTDCAKGRAMVVRALNAKDAGAVPLTQGTFLERLTYREGDQVYEKDAFIAWGAAAVLVLAMFLPAAGSVSLFEAYSGMDPIALPFISGMALAVLVALASFLPWSASRGLAQLVLWCVFSVVAAFMIGEGRYGLSDLQTIFRNDPWFIRPGTLLILAANLGVLAAAALGLAPGRPARIGIPVAVGVVIVAVLASASDLWGTRRPGPGLQVNIGAAADAPDGSHRREVTITIVNEGGRRFFVTPERSSAANAFLLVLEKRLGQGSSRDITHDYALEGARPRPVDPGGRLAQTALIEPGVYEVSLQTANLEVVATEQFVIQEPVTVEAPSAEPEPAPEIIPEPEPAPEVPAPVEEVMEGQPEAPAEVIVTGPAVELRGILTADDREPQFRFVIHLPDGSSVNLNARMGERVFETWAVQEYNPAQPAVTLQNEQERQLIVRQGERTPFSDAF